MVVQPVQEKAEVHEGGHVPWVTLGGAPIRGRGPVEVAFGFEGKAQVEVRPWCAGLPRDHIAPSGSPLVGIALLREQGVQLLVCGGVGGVLDDGVATGPDGAQCVGACLELVRFVEVLPGVLAAELALQDKVSAVGVQFSRDTEDFSYAFLIAELDQDPTQTLQRAGIPGLEFDDLPVRADGPLEIPPFTERGAAIGQPFGVRPA